MLCYSPAYCRPSGFDTSKTGAAYSSSLAVIDRPGGPTTLGMFATRQGLSEIPVTIYLPELAMPKTNFTLKLARRLDAGRRLSECGQENQVCRHHTAAFT